MFKGLEIHPSPEQPKLLIIGWSLCLDYEREEDPPLTGWTLGVPEPNNLPVHTLIYFLRALQRFCELNYDA